MAAVITKCDERVWSGWIMPSDRPKDYPKNSDEHCATCGGQRTIISSDADTARFRSRCLIRKANNLRQVGERVLGVGFGLDSTGDGGQCGVMAVLNHDPVSPPRGQLANPGSPNLITNSRSGLPHAGRVGGSLRHACLRIQAIERGCSGCRGAQQVRLWQVAIFQPSRN